MGNLILRILEGVLIGFGAVLPGVSGGVLCVLFGVYKPIMRLLAHPLKELKNSAKLLIPVLIGFAVGYVGIAKALEVVLETYESQALALFVGMTIGMMPSLLREAAEKGRNRSSWISMGVVFVLALALLTAVRVGNMMIVPNFFWNMFCGFCLALSIIVPGMSSSTLMLPLQMQVPATESMPEGIMTLYQHATGAIGNFNMDVLIPMVIGAALTVVLLTKLIDWLMEHRYSVMFHGIIGIVIAATIFTIPVAAFTQSVSSCLIHLVFVVIGAVITLLLDRMNRSVEKPE